MSPKIVVIGAGVVGASIAWHLARRRARVAVVDSDRKPAGGVTRHSYGWVGTGTYSGAIDPIEIGRAIDAIREFKWLDSLVPLPVAAQGALIWSETDQETAELIAQQRMFGVEIEALDRASVERMDPALADIPSLVAWAPNDFAVEPVLLAERLIDVATDAGCDTSYGTTIERIRVHGNRAVGVETSQGFIPADVIVLANGMGAASLAAPFGSALPLIADPAVLMRFGGVKRMPRYLVYANYLELRPGMAHELVSAEAYPEEGEGGLVGLANLTGSRVQRLLGLSTPPQIHSVSAAFRPMTMDGSPLCGFIPELAGIYVAVAHPGLTLAPLLGRLAADEILNQ